MKRSQLLKTLEAEGETTYKGFEIKRWKVCCDYCVDVSRKGSDDCETFDKHQSLDENLRDALNYINKG